MTYDTEQLSRVVGAQDSTLVHPNLLLYLPCARPPLLANGVVEVPRYFVWFDDAFQPHPYEDTSPFLGIEDLYPVQRLPLTDGVDPPAGVVVDEVERRVAGAIAVAPASKTQGS